MLGSRVYIALCAPAVAYVAALPVLTSTSACRRLRPPLASPIFTDNFDRAELGPEWNPTANTWNIQNGHLHVSDAHNYPIWLRRSLPRNARIEFDAWSNSSDGDIKCEVYGDGHSFSSNVEYTATSYVVIFGGWFNRYDVIARQDERSEERR